jgi:arsenite methyltransferase
MFNCIGTGAPSSNAYLAGAQHALDSGADLNAYAKVENQSGCCSPAMSPDGDCCGTVHSDLSGLLATYDVNAAAASVKVYAVKPSSVAPQAPCCGPACCTAAK